MTEKSILVVDDEPDIRSTVQEILADEGYRVATADCAAAARACRESQPPDLVLLDIWMPDEDGITVLKGWRDDGQLDFPVVMMSGHGTVETAVEATRIGAVDFIEKPLSLQRLLMTVERSLSQWRAPGGAPARAAERPRPIELAGASAYMRGLREHVERLAGTRAAVLLCGPSGSLKLNIAQHIHLASQPEAPFVLLAADAVEERTAAVELFGSEYDGQWHPGILEQADGGTLYVQDVLELPLPAQKLLAGALERGDYTAVGGGRSRPFSLRVIAGTTEELSPLVAAGRFNAELYYQLNVVPIQTLSLNEHREDIPPLVEACVRALVEQDELPYRHVNVAAQNRLRNHDWRGNALELRNTIKRLLILGQGSEIDLAAVEQSLQLSEPGAATIDPDSMPLPLELPLREARAVFERAYLSRQLAAVGGRMGELANRVGMERTHLYRKLRSLGIDAHRARE